MRHCQPYPCPLPVSTSMLPAPAVSSDYGAAGIFGEVPRPMVGTDIGTVASQAQILAGEIVGGDVRFAPAMQVNRITRGCPPDPCSMRPVPRPVFPMPAGEDGRPLVHPIGPPPSYLGPPPIAPRPDPMGRRPQYMPGPGPTPHVPPAWLGQRPRVPQPMPRPRRPGRVSTTIPVGPTPPPTMSTVPGRRPVDTRTVIPPFMPPFVARPVKPSLIPSGHVNITGRSDIYQSINGFGAVQTSVDVYGGGIFETTAGRTQGHDIGFQPQQPWVMGPGRCPPPQPPPCPGEQYYPAPTIAMPGQLPCPAPMVRCPSTPSYDVAVPDPTQGCSGFGALPGAFTWRRAWQDPPDPDRWRRRYRPRFRWF